MDIEISLLNCTTKAALTAQEIINVLENNPSSEDVLKFKVSVKAQNQLRNLLNANGERVLSKQENIELDELSKIENIFRMLKLRVAKDLKTKTQNVN